MTQCSAIQYIPDKIRVNAVAPTAIESELIKVFSVPSELLLIFFHSYACITINKLSHLFSFQELHQFITWSCRDKKIYQCNQPLVTFSWWYASSKYDLPTSWIAFMTVDFWRGVKIMFSLRMSQAWFPSLLVPILVLSMARKVSISFCHYLLSC